MKKIAAWILVLVLMGFAAGCASMDANQSYDKVREQNRGLAGGVGDLHPNSRQ
jgi:hypothetical protein